MDITVGGITYHADIPEWDALVEQVAGLVEQSARIEAKIDQLLEGGGTPEPDVHVVFTIGPVSEQ